MVQTNLDDVLNFIGLRRAISFVHVVHTQYNRQITVENNLDTNVNNSMHKIGSLTCFTVNLSMYKQ